MSYECGHEIEDQQYETCPRGCKEATAELLGKSNRPPQPEDMKLFSAREIFTMIQAMKDELSTKMDEIPEQVPDIVENYLKRKQQEKWRSVKDWLKKYVPAGGWGALIATVIEWLVVG